MGTALSCVNPCKAGGQRKSTLTWATHRLWEALPGLPPIPLSVLMFSAPLKNSNKQVAVIVFCRPGRSERMERPQVLLTVCRELRLHLLTGSCCPGSLCVYSMPAEQLLLNLVCQLPCWLMVRGGANGLPHW